jgi:hypothetical protein
MDNFRRDSVHSCGRFAINLGGLSRERAIPPGLGVLLRGRHPITYNHGVVIQCIWMRGEDCSPANL